MPRPPLIIGLALGAGLIAVAQISPILGLVAIAYHGLLTVLLIVDAAALPAAGWEGRRQIPKPLSLGASEEIVVVLGNPRAAGLEAALADHTPAELNPTTREVAGRFDEMGSWSARYGVQAGRRGVHQFGALDLRVWRPRGWWLRQVRLHIPEAASVFPSVLPIRQYQLTLRQGMPLRSGHRRARLPGSATAFAGLRDYMPGDDLRRINWKATARRDQPVSVDLEAERGQQVMILVDCGRLMTAPAGSLNKLDHAVNAALLLGWLAQQQGDRVGLLAFSDDVDAFLLPRRSARQLARLSELLNGVSAQFVESDYGQAFAQLARRVSRRSLVVVLTDVLDPAASAELVQHAVWLSRRHLVLVVAMEDPTLVHTIHAPLDIPDRVYEWAAAEELLAERRQSFDSLRRGGVLGLDVPAGELSPSLVERYLEVKERALL